MTSLKTSIFQIWKFLFISYFDFLEIYLTVQPYFETMKHYILQCLIFNDFWKKKRLEEGKSQKKFVTLELLLTTCTCIIYVMKFDDRPEDRETEDRNSICSAILMHVWVFYRGEGDVLADLKVWFDVLWGDLKKHLTCSNVAETASSEVNVIQLCQPVHLK